MAITQEQGSGRFRRDSDFGFKFSFDAGRIVNGENTSCLVNELDSLHQAELLASDVAFIARSINSYMDGDAHTVICEDAPDNLEEDTASIESFVDNNPRPGDSLIVVGINYLFTEQNPRKHEAGQSLAKLTRNYRSVLYGITVGPKYPLLFRDDSGTTRNFLDYIDREHVFKNYIQCEDAVNRLTLACEGDVQEATRLAKQLWRSETGLTYDSLDKKIDQIQSNTAAKSLA